MENAQVCRRSSPPGHSLFGLATSDQWGCFTLFYLLRKPCVPAGCAVVRYMVR